MENGKKFFRTHTDIAQRYQTTRQTVSEWAKRPGWPKKAGGTYDGEAIDKFLREHKIGPYRRQDPTLVEARLKYLTARTEGEELRNQEQGIKTQTALGGVILAADAERFYVQTAGAVCAAADEIVDILDRELPADLSPKVRDRCLAGGRRISVQIRDLIRGLLANDDDQENGS